MKYWLLLFCNLFSLCLFAEEVPLSDARNWAVNFFQNQTGTRAGSVKLNMVWDGEDINSRSNSQPAFYVFNREDNKGFVIVSGDDLVNPLIGYSFEHEFQVKDMPMHLRSWLMSRKAEINYIRNNQKAALDGAKYYWSNSSSSVGKVLKKIETAQWNQGAPYNAKCPVDQNTGRTSVTGCVATAFAIALKAREWPDVSMGTVPAYTYETNQGNEVSIPEHPLGHTYHWDKMPLENITPSSDEEAIEEISTLMEDCGKMVQAQYSSFTTGAYTFNVAKALRKYLKYSPNLEYESREYHSTTTWNAMIQKELNEIGPVIYSGSSSDGGHAFVLDGYTDTNYYSVNWGWGGTANGFFTLSLLNPDNYGIGGGHAEDGYNFLQGGIFLMKKATAGEIYEKYPIYNLIAFNFSQIQKYYYGLVPDTNSIKPGEKFFIEKLSFVNNSFRGIYPLEVNVSIFDKNHQYKQSVSQTIFTDDLPENYIQSIDSVECQVPGTVAEGDYLAVGYRPKGCTMWKEMIGSNETQYRIPLLSDNFASTKDALVLSSGGKYDDVYWGMQSSRKVIKKNQEFFIKTGCITNTYFEPFKGLISVGHFDKDGNLKARVSKGVVSVLNSIQVGQYAEYTISSCKVTSDIVEGDYIALCYLTEGSETWKRIPPLTGVTGRINLDVQGKEILDKETSFRYIKKDKEIRLSTLEGTSFDWQDAEGKSIQSGVAVTGAVTIQVASLNKGSYNLVLKFGEQTKTIQIIL